MQNSLETVWDIEQRVDTYDNQDSTTQIQLNFISNKLNYRIAVLWVSAKTLDS